MGWDCLHRTGRARFRTCDSTALIVRSTRLARMRCRERLVDAEPAILNRPERQIEIDRTERAQTRNYFALPETRVTLHSGDIGNTSGLCGSAKCLGRSVTKLLTASAQLRHRSRMQCSAGLRKTARIHFRIHLTVDQRMRSVGVARRRG